jgi:hypothetical protein
MAFLVWFLVVVVSASAVVDLDRAAYGPPPSLPP